MRSHISIEEAARRLDVDAKEIERAITRGKLSALRVGDTYRIHEADFQRWIRPARSKKTPLLAALLITGLFVGVGSAVSFELGQNTSSRTTNNIPRVLPFEGCYTLDGQAASGSVSMAFDLYTVDGGGMPIWSSDDRMVNLDDGRFAVVLGDANDTNPIPEDAFASSALYLEVVAESEVLSPRQRIAPAPQAVTAARAASDFTVPGSLDADSLVVSGDVALGDSPTDTTTLAGDLFVDNVRGDLFLEGDIKRELPNGGGANIFGTYCGATPTTTDRAISTGTDDGYVAARKLCEGVSTCGAGAHMCSAHEALISVQRDLIPNLQNDVEFWVSNMTYAIERDDESAMRDCIGWRETEIVKANGNITREYATTLRSYTRGALGRVVAPERRDCTESYPIFCCK